MNEAVHSDAVRGPARPDSLTVDFYQEPDALVIRTRRGGGPWPFVLLWLIAWTAGCAALIIHLLHDPSLGMLLFALPFWASWLFVAGLLAWMMFGREALIVGPAAAVFVRTALVRLSTRVVPREEVQGFRACRSRHTENDESLWGIEMLTLGKPVRFAFQLPDREREWLLHQLNGFLATSLPDEERQAPPAGGDQRPRSICRRGARPEWGTRGDGSPCRRADADGPTV
jgi:hypothetical protein